jgi:hypothetical protein
MPSNSRGNHSEHTAEYELYVEAANLDRAREILAALPKPDPVAPDVIDQQVGAARRDYGRLLAIAGCALLVLMVTAVVVSLV